MPEDKTELPESMRAASGDVELGPNDVAKEDQVPPEEQPSYPPRQGYTDESIEAGKPEPKEA
jgi:hypothetical protein